jgi:hypothetical protein
MNLYKLYPTNAVLRVTVKSVVVTVLAAAAIFCAATGYGLLKVLVQALQDGTEIGIAELSTHSATMLLFLALAGLCAYLAKKSI